MYPLMTVESHIIKQRFHRITSHKCANDRLQSPPDILLGEIKNPICVSSFKRSFRSRPLSPPQPSPQFSRWSTNVANFMGLKKGQFVNILISPIAFRCAGPDANGRGSQCLISPFHHGRRASPERSTGHCHDPDLCLSLEP